MLLWSYCVSYFSNDILFQAECYHYLFDAAIKLHQLGLDWSTPDHGPIQNVKGVSGVNGRINVSTKAGAVDSNYKIEPFPVRNLHIFPSVV